MIESLASKYSGCNSLKIPLPAELHLWLWRRDSAGSSDSFLRHVLSFYTDVPGQLMQFVRGPQGKPALLSPSLPLDFNLSDSGDWLSMAVSGGAPVGIDIEFCDSRRDVLKLARRFYSDEELADLQACDPEERSNRFYDYWTLKEASIKAAGVSLGSELEQARFSLRYPTAACPGDAVGHIAAPPRPSDDVWYGLLQPLKGYRMALCCLSSQDFSGGLRLLELLGTGEVVDRPVSLRALSSCPDVTPGVVCP